MGWRWVPDHAPEDDTVLAKRFPTQGEAESWLGEFYPELLEVGVGAVSLYEEDRLVYGPMRLDTEPT
jgi:hypothetical protein